MLSNTITVAIKDLRVLFKDKGALAVLFLLPIIFSVIQGAPQKALGNVGETTPSGESSLVIEAYLVNEDTGSYGRQLAEALEQAAILDVKKLDSADEADLLVADGERPAAIIIPADLTHNIDNYLPSQILVRHMATKFQVGLVFHWMGAVPRFPSMTLTNPYSK